MKCIICKHGETADGTATVTIERNALTFVVKSVPARVCNSHRKGTARATVCRKATILHTNAVFPVHAG
jgi:YgiT-type zinc finger domain-containing protein